MSLEDDIRAEREADELFRAFVRDNREALRLIAHWGDGHCGYIVSVIADELGMARDRTPSRTRPKAVIPRALAKQVFERDAYRCIDCSTHIDLCCDHVIPESKGGPTTLDNLRTRCRPCNSRKGTRS